MHRKTNVTLCAVTLCATASFASAAINFDGSGGGVLAESFDSLSSTTWANDSTLPGWSLFRQPAPGTAITSIAVNSGSSNSGSFYSYGADADPDRALGGLGSGGSYFGSPASGSVAGWMAVAITNATGSTISWWGIEYVGEQWRNANSSAQTMVFEYGYGATFDAVATWTAPGAAWDFTSPTFGGTAGALDGNAPANRVTGIGNIALGQTWGAGETLWMRWTEVNDTGSDHGLAIDEWAFRSVPAPGAGAMLGLGLVVASRRRR